MRDDPSIESRVAALNARRILRMAAGENSGRPERPKSGGVPEGAGASRHPKAT